MPQKCTPIRDLFVNTGTTRSKASNAKVWACARCGWELVENATRFARHITRCPNATNEDQDIAREHLEAGMSPDQINLIINNNAEFTRAFSLDGKAHVRNLFQDTHTTRQGLCHSNFPIEPKIIASLWIMNTIPYHISSVFILHSGAHGGDKGDRTRHLNFFYHKRTTMSAFSILE